MLIFCKCSILKSLLLNMNRQQLLKEIYQQIFKAKRIFVQGHGNCGDAAGSTLAMAYWLRSMGKDYLAFSPEQIPDNLSFLPGAEEIIADSTKFDLKEFDVLLILDCGDLSQTGIADKIQMEKSSAALLINIDHHYTNDSYGDINFVDKMAPSTTTLVHEFMKVNDLVIDKKVATNLLCGIFTDTGIFSNPATNQEALNKASDLLIAGASLGSILNSVLKNRSVVSLKLWGRALERLTLNTKYKLAYTVLLQDDFRELGADSADEIEGLANFLNNLGEAKVTMVLTEKKGGQLKGSFRTTDDSYDVGQLASLLGGGGHKKASGFTISGLLRYNDKDGRWEVI